VVVIIDEYDQPLLATIDHPEIQEQIRNGLSGFFSTLKSCDSHLRFVFVTGVTKFARVSLFSGANQLDDISLDPRYACICGITQEELEANFTSEIESVASQNRRSYRQHLKKLRAFYNGYRFSKSPITVYNPFGLLFHFTKGGEFNHYWYESGSPSFLIKLIKDQKIDITRIHNKEVGANEFCKFDIATMDATVVLYQAGYLTIADYDSENSTYSLDYPNTEVTSAFADSLVTYHLGVSMNDTSTFARKLPIALRRGDIYAAMDTVKSLLASIPYEIIKPTENYFETAIFLMMRMIGLDSVPEFHTSYGRIDTLVRIDNYIYCFEYKFDQSPDLALKQIDSKEYPMQWRTTTKTVYKVGVQLDSETRNIADWKHAIENGTG
jgi:hypothetical protein